MTCPCEGIDKDCPICGGAGKIDSLVEEAIIIEHECELIGKESVFVEKV